MIYELRQYVIKPDRMADCHRMFREVVIPAFMDVGIRPVAFWEPSPADGTTFIYIVAFESTAAREALWPKFIEHRKWQDEKARWTDGAPYASTKATVLAPTEYSAKP